MRPEVRALLIRWREVLVACALVLAGLWLVSRGGWLLGGVGLAVGIAGVGLAFVALRRLRFSRPVTDPGLVEVLEGQISYLGPQDGGWVALSELSELALVQQGAAWRLRQADGRVLLIPAAAKGADRLFDTFAGLPGIDMGAVLRALNHPGPDRLLWRRSTEGQPRIGRRVDGPPAKGTT